MTMSSSVATLPLMVGVPDDGLVVFRFPPKGRAPGFVIPGTAGFHNQLPAEVRDRMPAVYFGPSGSISVSDAGRHQPLVNFTAEPDACGRSLRILDEAVSAADIACFNHPRAVRDSTREAVARKLSTIPGVHMPITVRARIEQPDDLEPLVAQSGLKWPVIVRLVGTHAGVATVRIDGPDEIADKLKTIPWGGRTLYLTEYVDYADPDGMHRKMRVVVVGKDIFLRHVLVTSGWHVHARDHDKRFDETERQLIDGFATGLLPQLRMRVSAIADAMDLDYFGIDCNLRPDGELLVFEANANMNILYNSRPEALHCVREMKRITEAVVALLERPHQWRHPGRSARAR